MVDETSIIKGLLTMNRFNYKKRILAYFPMTKPKRVSFSCTDVGKIMCHNKGVKPIIVVLKIFE